MSERGIDVAAEGDRFLAVARASANGRKVAAVVDQPGQRVMLMAFTAGAGLPEHEPPPAATLQVLRGTLRLVAGGRSWTLPAGHLTPIPQERHHVEAVEDSVALLWMTTVGVP